MPKRTTQDSGRKFDSKDNPIGLTGAFAPVQSQDDSYDDPVGLTDAFAPVGEAEPSEWDTEDKWAGFDWDAPLPEQYGEDAAGDSAEEASEDEPSDEEAGEVEEAEGEAGEGAAPEADGEATAASTDASTTGAHAAVAGGTGGSGARSGSGKHARHAVTPPEPSERMKKARKTRRKLVIAIVLLVIVVAAALVIGYRMLTADTVIPGTETSQQDAVEETEELTSEVALDAEEAAVRLADVPDLSALFGKTQQEAIDYLQRGAAVTASREVGEGEDEEVIKQTVTIALTEEPGGSRGGLPTVYLGLDKDGKIVQVGYSASVATLGISSVDFAGAVETDRIIESTLRKVGADVPDGVAVISDDTLQTTYAKDGTTVQKERCSFAGDIDVNGVPCTWSAVLSYDYTAANISGNVSEVVRLIYVYITMK